MTADAPELADAVIAFGVKVLRMLLFDRDAPAESAHAPALVAVMEKIVAVQCKRSTVAMVIARQQGATPVDDDMKADVEQAHGPLITDVMSIVQARRQATAEDVTLGRKLAAEVTTAMLDRASSNVPGGQPEVVQRVMREAMMGALNQQLAGRVAAEWGWDVNARLGARLGVPAERNGGYLVEHPACQIAIQELTAFRFQVGGKVVVLQAEPPGLAGPFIGLPGPEPQMQNVQTRVRHLGGHPGLGVDGRARPVLITSVGMSIYKDRQGRDDLGIVEFGKVRSIRVEDADGPQQRVTVPRLAAGGIFAFAKPKKQKRTCLIITPNEGAEVIFEIQGFGTWELRGALSPLLSLFGA